MLSLLWQNGKDKRGPADLCQRAPEQTIIYVLWTDETKIDLFAMHLNNLFTNGKTKLLQKRTPYKQLSLVDEP